MLIPITNQSIIKALALESANISTMLKNFYIKFENVQLVPTPSGTKVQMVDEAGNTIVIGLEQHLHNEIMNYCIKNF